MTDTNFLAISELSDAELDTVAAGWGYSYSFKQLALGNTAVQVAENNQVNIAAFNYKSSQGGAQANNNNAGNQA